MQSVDVARGPLASIWRQDPCSVLFEAAKRAPGENIRLVFGGDQIIVLQDAAGAQHVLGTAQDKYSKHFATFETFFGRSRLTTDGAEWQRLQRLSQPYISQSPAEKIIATTRTCYSAAAAEMIAQAGAVLLDPLLDAAAAQVVSQIVLGFPLAELGPGAMDDFRALLRIAMETSWNIGAAVRPVDAGTSRDASAAKARLSTAVDRLVTKARARNPAGEDLIDAVALAEPPVDVLGEICTLVFAGFDTTSTAIGWSLFLLAAQPDIQAQLRAEIRALDRPDDWRADDLEGLPGLSAFIDEALRIFPPIPILSRIAVEADSIAGTPIAPGQKVLVSLIGLHHDRRVFPNPAKVDLNRAQSTSQPSRRQGFIPFGVGRRHCGGARFANLEMAAALATLLNDLSFRLSDRGPVLFEWTVSLRRRGGQRLLVSRAA